MASTAQTSLAWLRRTLAWSNSREAWEERFAFVGLAIAAAGLVWFGGTLPGLVQVVLWGILLVLVALLLRRGWLHLFGPVLFYDLVPHGPAAPLPGRALVLCAGADRARVLAALRVDQLGRRPASQ